MAEFDKSTTTNTGSNEDLKQRARDLASESGRRAGDRASQVGSRGMNAVGDRIDRAADYIDQRRGQETPMGNRLHETAAWLREHDGRDLMEQLDHQVRNHPYRTMAIGLGVGYLLGRLFSR